jgi:hypothetical protein
VLDLFDQLESSLGAGDLLREIDRPDRRLVSSLLLAAAKRA